MADLQWNKAFALEQTAGDEELLEELLVLFKDSAASDLEQLRQAITADDAAGVVRAAHSLKGASASLGIEGIRTLATAMETDAREGATTVAQAKIEEMSALLEQVQTL
ncbi:MAG: Hpt domain-containing protein [Desulfobulbus sp.]|nr:Hpt domain-containing protein [Desulfobulbus sp.]